MNSVGWIVLFGWVHFVFETRIGGRQLEVYLLGVSWHGRLVARASRGTDVSWHGHLVARASRPSFKGGTPMPLGILILPLALLSSIALQKSV